MVEEIKLIVEALDGLGELGLWALVIVVAERVTGNILGVGAVVTVAFMLFRTIRRGMEATSFAHRLLGVIEDKGYRGTRDCEHGPDKNAILNLILERLPKKADDAGGEG